MSDNYQIEQLGQDNRQNTANTVIHFLPPFENSNSERRKREENLEIILQPIYDFLPDFIPIESYRIDARIPHRLCNRTNFKLLDTQKGIDPLDESIVYMTLIGKMGIKDISPRGIEHPGYTIYLSAPQEDFDVARNYLSSAYNTEIINSPLRGIGLRHTEERDSENNIITHSFVDGEAIHQIKLSVRNEFERSIKPFPDEEEEIYNSPREISLRRTLFDNGKVGEFFIDDLPCLEEDNQEKEKILKNFIETASLFFELGSFNLEYNKKKIYTNNNLDTFPNIIEVGPLVVSFTGEKQHLAGIKTFAGLIIARLRYPFAINSMKISAHSKTQINNFRTYLPDNTKVKLILEREISRPLRTQLIYELSNVQDNFDFITNIISEATEETPTNTNSTETHISAYATKGKYTYIVSIKK